MRKGCWLSPLLFSRVFEILNRAFRQEKEIKRDTYRKGWSPSFIISKWHDLCQQDLKHAAKTPKTKFLCVQFTKSSVWKSLVFLYTNNELTEKEIKRTLIIHSDIKRIKYLGRIDLTKEMKDLYSENYITLEKEIREDIRKWKDSPRSWIGRANAIRITMLQN